MELNGSVDAFKKIYPHEFYKKFIDKSIRPDGRKLNETRRTSIKSGVLKGTYGSSLVRMGKTTVMTGITLEVGKPAEATPRYGELDVQVHVTPICSPDVPIGKPSDKSIALGKFFTRCILGSRAISQADLCIVEGQSAWVIHADIVCLEFDGNIEDVGLIGLVAALRNFRFPSIDVDKETGVVRIIQGEYGGGIPFAHCPIPLTCIGFENRPVVDPTCEEENLASTTITVVTNQNDQLCAVYKPGGKSIDPDFMKASLSEAKLRVKGVLHLLKQAVNDE